VGRLQAEDLDQHDHDDRSHGQRVQHALHQHRADEPQLKPLLFLGVSVEADEGGQDHPIDDEHGPIPMRVQASEQQGHEVHSVAPGRQVSAGVIDEQDRKDEQDLSEQVGPRGQIGPKTALSGGFGELLAAQGSSSVSVLKGRKDYFLRELNQAETAFWMTAGAIRAMAAYQLLGGKR
jgi:hypothetical protein